MTTGYSIHRDLVIPNWKVGDKLKLSEKCRDEFYKHHLSGLIGTIRIHEDSHLGVSWPQMNTGFGHELEYRYIDDTIFKLDTDKEVGWWLSRYDVSNFEKIKISSEPDPKYEKLFL